MTERRTFLGAVAALALTRWGKGNYEPEDLGWQDLQEGGRNLTGEFTPKSMATFSGSRIGDIDIMAGMLDETNVDVHYDSSGVLMDLDGKGDDVRTGGYAVLSPEQAKQMGAALYQAATELEHIKSQEYDPSVWEDVSDE